MHNFALILSIGTAVGLIWLAWRSPESQRLNLVNAGISALVGALIGARILFAIIHWHNFRTHLIEILHVWSGGYSWFGAFLGAAVGIFIFSFVTKLKLSSLVEELIPLAGLIVVSSWLGCWLSGCAYGEEWLSVLAVPARDEWGRVLNRVPVQLSGALIGLVWMWGLESLGKPRSNVNGRTAAIAILTLGLQFGGLFFLRADPSVQFLGLRGDIWGALILIVVGSVWLLCTFTGRDKE